MAEAIFCLFVPALFVTRLSLNLLGVWANYSAIALAAAVTVYVFAHERDWFERAEAPRWIGLLVAGVTLVLAAVNQFVGLDRGTDTYVYHLNSALPLALGHPIVGSNIYNLIAYSQGYPKAGELAQAALIAVTGNAWSLGLLSVLVVPASYAAASRLARAVGLGPKAAAVAALAYALNPINVAQATSGYVDSLFALYVLISLGFLFSPPTRFTLMGFAGSLIVLANLKFSGVPLTAILAIAFLVAHRRWISAHVGATAAVALPAAGLAAAHYLVNGVGLGSTIYPFVDRTLMALVWEPYSAGGSRLQQIADLFWALPATPAHVALVDAPVGGFSALWYPFPLLIALATVVAAWRRQWRFVAVQGLLAVMLVGLPVEPIARYVAWYQWAGFASLAWLVFTFAPDGLRRGALVLPAAYTVLAVYVVFQPTLGLVAQRIAKGHELRVIERARDSTLATGLDVYADVHGVCSGLYWLLRWSGLQPKLVAALPAGADNYLYLESAGVAGCHIRSKFPPRIGTELLPGSSPQRATMKYRIDRPFGTMSCLGCITDYGCMYVPIWEGGLIDIPFAQPGEKTVRTECRMLDGSVVSEEVGVDIPPARNSRRPDR